MWCELGRWGVEKRDRGKERNGPPHVGCSRRGADSDRGLVSRDKTHIQTQWPRHWWGSLVASSVARSDHRKAKTEQRTNQKFYGIYILSILRGF